MRQEIHQSEQLIEELREDLLEARVRNRALEREISMYQGSRVHRVAGWASGRVARRRLTRSLDPGRAESSRPPRPEAPLFDEVFYLTENPDVFEAGVDPWIHYCEHGWAEGRDPNPLFDTDWYAARYPAAVAGGRNPLIEYVVHGWRAGRDPSKMFNTDWYLRTYPDVRAAGVNPLLHFLKAGAAENRKPSYRFSPRQYESNMAAEGVPLLGGGAPGDLLRRRSMPFLVARKERTRAACQADLDFFLSWEGGLEIRNQDAQITVILVVWNQAALTLACMRTLSLSTVPLRVILVDNGSTDETGNLLAQVGGIEVIRNDDNLGFVLAVNQALDHVQTPYVALVNNDAEVAPDALGRAVEVLADSSVGAVGGRVILPNLLLQEAGSYLDDEARAHGYLRGEPSWSGDAMYRRPVDFCSGVFLALRTGVFRDLGGLDPQFAPAYGEEVDLCMRLWARGMEVHYDPRILVKHLEYGSSSDLTGPSELMERNRGLLAERYGDALGVRKACDDQGDMLATSRISSTRVLFIEDRVPRQFEGAGFPRSASMVRALDSQGAFVTVLPMHGGDQVDWTGIWSELGSTVRVLPEIEVEGAADYIADCGRDYDVIWVCRAHNLARLESALTELRGGSPVAPAIVYDSECISTLREMRLPQTDPAAVAARARQELLAELRPAGAADVFVAVNEAEAEIAEQILPEVRTCVIGEAAPRHSGDPIPGPTERRGVLVVGRHTDPGSPNVDALNWFIREVVPLLPDDVGINVVGLVDPGAVLPSDRVEMQGAVEELGRHYDVARVFIAPQRFAAGNPHKVIEAAAAGVPTVATGLIAGQLGWEPGREIAVADTAEGFAREVGRLLTDDGLWLAMSQAARDRASADHSEERFDASVGRVLAMVRPQP